MVVPWPQLPREPKVKQKLMFGLVRNRLMGFELPLICHQEWPAANMKLFLLFPCKISSDSNPRIRLSRRLPLFTKLSLLLLLSPLQKLSLFKFSFSSFAKLLLLAVSTMEAMLLIPFRAFMVVVVEFQSVLLKPDLWLGRPANLMARAETRYLLESAKVEKLSQSPKTALLTQIWIALGCTEVCNANWKHVHAIECSKQLRLE